LQTAGASVQRHGKLLSLTDRNANTVTLSYDASFCLPVSDASGRTLTFTFGYWDMVSSVSDSQGTVATYTNYRGGAETVRYPDGSGFNFNPLLDRQAGIGQSATC